MGINRTERIDQNQRSLLIGPKILRKFLRHVQIITLCISLPTYKLTSRNVQTAHVIFGTIICTDLMFQGIAYFWVLGPGETFHCVIKLFFLIPCNNNEETPIWYKALLLTTSRPSLLTGLGSLKDG